MVTAAAVSALLAVCLDSRSGAVPASYTLFMLYCLDVSAPRQLTALLLNLASRKLPGWAGEMAQ